MKTKKDLICTIEISSDYNIMFYCDGTYQCSNYNKDDYSYWQLGNKLQFRHHTTDGWNDWSWNTHDRAYKQLIDSVIDYIIESEILEVN